MTERIEPVKKPSLDAEKLRLQAKEARESAALNIQEQIASEDSLMTYAELGSTFNLLAMGKDFRELDKHMKKTTQVTPQAIEEEEELDPVLSQKVAEQFQKKNPELNARALLALRANISNKDTQETILTKVRNTYPDPSLADDTLDFLIESSPQRAALREKIQAAKEQFNAIYGKDVRAGKNIQQAAHEFSTHGLGSPTALRDLYRSVIGNPKEAAVLFEELANAFPFPKMKAVIDFIMHSLGHDMKSKGPSISHPELHKLFSEIRTMQAILGVYRFFYSRMNLIQGEFKRCDLTLPAMINFQNLAKTFMKIIKERYPSVQRILAFAGMLGISKEILAQIIIFSQFRDALRNVSPKFFKSEQHRQDMLTTFIETLSDLDDTLEKEEDDEEEEEDTQ